MTSSSHHPDEHAGRPACLDRPRGPCARTWPVSRPGDSAVADRRTPHGVSVASAALPPFDAWRSCAVAADVAAASLADEGALAARREHRSGALLTAAARDSPLYRGMLRGRDVSTLGLEQLPIVHLRAGRRRDGDLRRDRGAAPTGAPSAAVLAGSMGHAGTRPWSAHARRARLDRPSWPCAGSRQEPTRRHPRVTSG